MAVISAARATESRKRVFVHTINMPPKYDYFTYCNAAATGAALVATAVNRCSGRTAPVLAVYLVISGMVVSIMGSWVLAYRMKVDKEFHRVVLRSQLWLHIMPLVVAVVIIAAWGRIAGTATKPRHLVQGLGVFALVFSAWMATPKCKSREVGLQKIEAVYQVRDPFPIFLIGVAIATGSVLLCHTRSHDDVVGMWRGDACTHVL